MNPQNKSQGFKIVVLVLFLVLGALFIGWLMGRSGSNVSTESNTSVPNQTTVSKSTENGEVKSMASYTLPDGWAEDSCPNSNGVIYVVPNDTNLDCNANPSAPIKIYRDPQNTTDCQQLNNVQDVIKHVCISLYIDGHKSLKASTVYPKTSSNNSDTTVSDYYIDTGKGVVKVEYTFISDNKYQMYFDQLATGIKVK